MKKKVYVGFLIVTFTLAVLIFISLIFFLAMEGSIYKSIEIYQGGGIGYTYARYTFERKGPIYLLKMDKTGQKMKEKIFVIPGIVYNVVAYQVRLMDIESINGYDDRAPITDATTTYIEIQRSDGQLVTARTYARPFPKGKNVPALFKTINSIMNPRFLDKYYMQFVFRKQKSKILQQFENIKKEIKYIFTI